MWLKRSEVWDLREYRSVLPETEAHNDMSYGMNQGLDIHIRTPTNLSEPKAQPYNAKSHHSLNDQP